MRTAGMTASPGLMLPRFRLPSWRRLTIHAVVLVLGVVALVTVAVFTAPHARADDYCTPEIPYAPYGAVCTGFMTYCSLSPFCTTQPNVPGTMGPTGYTPICGYESCRFN